MSNFAQGRGMILSSLNWDQLKKKFDELSAELASPGLESSKRANIQKELSFINKILAKQKEIENLKSELANLELQKSQNKDPELDLLYKEEISQLQFNLDNEAKEIEELMFPPDELFDRSIFLEIRAAAGGQESSLFVSDLLRMYTNYAIKKNWKVSISSSSQTDLGGYREVILHIEGKGVYGHLKNESGVHRVQRVPLTETQGRVHTSTATIAILPEAKEVDVTINPSDLRIDVFRAGGAGGQHVNVTDSAVRITHIPTGVVVSCQDERSQIKNKAKALKILQSRILASQKEKQEAEMSQKRKEMVGGGMRSEKVRTYNYPQNRITDHQVDLTLNKLDIIMEGELDEIIQALMEKDRRERKSILS